MRFIHTLKKDVLCPCAVLAPKDISVRNLSTLLQLEAQ